MVGISSVYLRLQQFREELPRAMRGLVASAVLFVQFLLDSGHLELSSAHQYCVLVASGYRLYDGVVLEDSSDRHLWALFRRALRRGGALVPKNQAPPLTPVQFAETIERKTLCMRMRLAILVAWLSAARGADLRSLKKERFVLEKRGTYTLDFTGTKTDPFQEGLFSRITFPEAYILPFEALMTSLGHDENVFPFSNHAITSALRATDPLLSAHSIRRGALTALLLRGSTLEDLRAFGRYRGVEGLLHYLPLARLPHLKKVEEMSRILHE